MCHVLKSLIQIMMILSRAIIVGIDKVEKLIGCRKVKPGMLKYCSICDKIFIHKMHFLHKDIKG
ncbi:hypothetical protein ACP275_04G009600 [Erythranthe tilingii]